MLSVIAGSETELSDTVEPRVVYITLALSLESARRWRAEENEAIRLVEEDGVLVYGSGDLEPVSIGTEWAPILLRTIDACVGGMAEAAKARHATRCERKASFRFVAGGAL